MAVRPWRLALAGAGNVGSQLLRLVDERGADLTTRYGVRLVVTGVAELGGAAVDRNGLEMEDVRTLLARGAPLASMAGAGRVGMTVPEMLTGCGADIFLDATPVDLSPDSPALRNTALALQRGMHTVLANKGPLASSFTLLRSLGDIGDTSSPRSALDPRPRLRFSATVAGALPAINIGRRDLAGCEVTCVEAVLNGTSQHVLRMLENGIGLPEAIADARRRGITESDPRLDIDGHDAAAKLVILMNSMMGWSASPADVDITGIADVTAADVRRAAERNARIVPMCKVGSTTNEGAHGAELRPSDAHRMTVGPVCLPTDHPLARMEPDEMGVVFYSRQVDRLSAMSLEPGAGPAAAAMLRDVLEIVRS